MYPLFYKLICTYKNVINLHKNKHFHRNNIIILDIKKVFNSQENN